MEKRTLKKFKLASSKKQLQTVGSCSTVVTISGLINRKTCSTIASELITYVLIQRDQVPDSFNSLLNKKLQQQPAAEVSTDLPDARKESDATVRDYSKARHNSICSLLVCQHCVILSFDLP